MKHTIPKAYKNYFFPAIIFPLIALLIWYVGPQLNIGGVAPLQRTDKRIYAIAVIFLSWVLKVIFFGTPAEKDAAQLSSLPSDLAKKLPALEGRFQSIVDFLKNTVLNKNGVQTNLANLPWYLWIGPRSAGKTSLLANSTVNYVLAKQFKSENLMHISPSDSCDWWVTRDAVMVDVPSSYCTQKEKLINKSLSSGVILWDKLIQLINTNCSKGQLKGVVITLNLPEIAKNPHGHEKNLLIQNVKKRIVNLREAFGDDLPFFLVITKCDLIPGFNEFFSECSSDEFAQSWGITLPIIKEKEKLTDVFVQRFNLLIKRLNKQLLFRMHQERNPSARPYIKDFPLHVERLKEGIANFLKVLMLPTLRLQGVYLTSAIQPHIETPANFFYNSTNSLTHQSLQIMQSPFMPSRAHFIRQFILHAILHPEDQQILPVKPHTSWQHYFVYATAASAVLVSAVLLGQDFQQSAQRTYSIQHDLAYYQTRLQKPAQDGDQLTNVLPLLNALQKTADTSVHQLSLLDRVLSFYSNKSQQTANTVYHQALQTLVLGEMQHYLEKYLRTAANKNPNQVYLVLEAYIMLSDSSHRHVDFIADTVNQIIPKPLSPSDLKELLKHLNTAFNNNTAVTLDSNLLASVRTQLLSQSSVDVAMLLLKNMDNNDVDSSIGLGTNSGNPPIFISKEVANRIPNMYTANNFEKILADEINIATVDALKGNWILGAIPPAPNQPTFESLVMQLRNQYVANYVDIWESQLANIKPFTPANLLQTDSMITTLTSKNSPLLQLLTTIKQNTSMPTINSASPKLQALNNMLAEVSSNQLYQVFANLQQLHTYLQTILSAPDRKKAAFQAAGQHMQNGASDPLTDIHHLAEQNPEPIKTWLNTLANQSWMYIMQTAGDRGTTV